MQLISLNTAAGPAWGVAEADTVRLAKPAAQKSLGDLLREGLSVSEIAALLGDETIARTDASISAPVSEASKIICVGLNYADHIAEMNRPTPEKPVIFSRWSDTFVGAGEALVRPRVSETFDYEGEFCLIIGKQGRYITKDAALDHVFGYTIMNDGSLRDYQRHTHQFIPGKNFPKSGSIGPVIVSRDEFGAVSNQKITTHVNDLEVQTSSLDQLVFDVADLIAYCSEWTTLNPGDIIATGTPGGVGDSFDPKLWMRPGDTVTVTVEGIGALSNPITAE